MANLCQDRNDEDNCQNTDPETGSEWCEEASPLHIYNFGLPNVKPVAGGKISDYNSNFKIVCFSFALIIL
jgi:hypothetical protein